MKLGAILLAPLLLGGCLITTEDQYLEDLPPLRNRPPRIVTVSVGSQSGMNVTVDMGADCPTVTFEAWVEDPDISDRIRYFWFVDYDFSDSAPLANRRPYETGFLNPNGLELREAVRLQITPGSIDNPLLPGSDNVQLVITDGILEITDPPGAIPPPDPVPGLDAGNPRYATSFGWHVTAISSSDCEGAMP